MKFDIEKAREELGEIGGEGFCDCETRNLLGAAIERIAELEQKEEALLVCMDCGKRIDEVDPVKNRLGTICFDPGDPGGREEPPEPACAFFVCAECMNKAIP